MLVRGNGLLLWVSLSPKKRINMEVLPFALIKHVYPGGTGTMGHWIFWSVWKWHESVATEFSLTRSPPSRWWWWQIVRSSTVIKAPNQGRIFWKNDIPCFHQSPSNFSEVFSHVSFGQILQESSQDRCCCSFSNKTQQETLPFSCFRATAHALCGLGEGAPCMPEAAQTTPIH